MYKTIEQRFEEKTKKLKDRLVLKLAEKVEKAHQLEAKLTEKEVKELNIRLNKNIAGELI